MFIMKKKKETDILKIIGNNIRNARLELKISQEELAHLCGLHRTYVGAIERGERNLTIKSLETISRVLKIEPSQILE